MLKKRLATLIMAAALVFTSVVSAAAYDTSSWDSVSTYPKDVMGTEYLTPVKYFMDKKILTGDEDGLFHADRAINRAEFAKIIALATNNTNQMEAVKDKNYFKDLDGYGWAKPYINCCANAGLVNGKGNDNFAPGESITYAEAITVIIRIKNTSAVSGGTWPDNYIQYAQMYMNTVIGDRGITDWNAPAERGDVVMMLYRTMPKN
ncbi:MAG: S-layer homology domain-containing protein [Anaerovoracaceae bacterium]